MRQTKNLAFIVFSLLNWTQVANYLQTIKNYLYNLSRSQGEKKPRYDTTYLLFFLRSFVVRFSLLITSFQSVFWSSLYFLLTLLFARYSYIYAFSSSLSRSSRRILAILASFIARFSQLAFTLFTSCSLWLLCLFPSSLFSLKTLSPRTWIITISSGWKSFSSTGIL